MSTNELIVDLDLPANERWHFLADYAKDINELLQCYLDDLTGAEFVFENITAYKEVFIKQEYLDEIACIASLSRFSPDEVLIANLYYDILKFYFGCTAFAFENSGTILHARNLDWHTENNLLSKHSKIFNFKRDGKIVFKTVGWPGFVGALSGLKPEKFAVTLNAVLSNDKPEIAYPVSFLIRDVLDTADSFEEARAEFENMPIASDCLLLLSGTTSDQLAVIERTPTRFATRKAENGSVIVTNDYKQLDNHLAEGNVLQSTSCGRYDRTKELLQHQKPSDADGCLSILKDEQVMMGITVQQMVFNSQTGDIKLIKTEGNSDWL
jgi:acid ceramidase